MPALSIGDCIKFAWETFKKRPGILIVAIILVYLIPSIPSILFPLPQAEPGGVQPPPTAAQVIALLVGIVLSIFATIGATTFYLRAHDNIANVTLSDLWNPQPFFRFLGAQILAGIIIIIGLILFIVPGIIAALGLFFAPFAVIDRGAGPINALKDSWRITKGNKWQLLLFALVLIGLNLLGLLALVIGLVVTIPMTWLAMVHAYRTLASQADAQTPQ